MITTPPPICRKCRLRHCVFYGLGYSVQCELCNAKQSDKRRAAYRLRKKPPIF